MDSYQPIFDAIRSRIEHVDIGSVVQNIITQEFSLCAREVGMSFAEVANEYMRPCVLLRPRLSIDGDLWCALYGDNIQDGVAGFGKSPSDAMHDFDKNYHTNLRTQ
jgi:hypothetical protein